MLEPSTSHIGRGVALAAQAAAPVYPRVYKHSSISDSRNDHSLFTRFSATAPRHVPDHIRQTGRPGCTSGRSQMGMVPCANRAVWKSSQDPEAAEFPGLASSLGTYSERWTCDAASRFRISFSNHFRVSDVGLVGANPFLKRGNYTRERKECVPCLSPPRQT